MANSKLEKLVAIIFWIVGSALLLVAILSDSWIASNQNNYGLLEWCRRQICIPYGKLNSSIEY